jgi:hypothetical protein
MSSHIEIYNFSFTFQVIDDYFNDLKVSKGSSLTPYSLVLKLIPAGEINFGTSFYVIKAVCVGFTAGILFIVD